MLLCECSTGKALRLGAGRLLVPRWVDVLRSAWMVVVLDKRLTTRNSVAVRAMSSGFLVR